MLDVLIKFDRKICIREKLFGIKINLIEHQENYLMLTNYMIWDGKKKLP